MTSIHQAAVYDSDRRFLAVALPFIQDGLAKGDPVMVATTSANLELLGNALGRDGRLIDYAESGFLGRRTVERATAFHRYWQRRAPEAPHGGHVRIIAEPVWTGQAPRPSPATDSGSPGSSATALTSIMTWTDARFSCRCRAPGPKS